MYRYYKKEGYDVMEYKFDSITEFLNYLDNSKINKEYFGNNPSSESRDYSFYHTETYEEAYELCKYGYHEKFKSFLDKKRVLEKYINESSVKLKQYNDYIGYVPDVKAYLEGNPLSMLNKNTPKRKNITIHFNISNPWYIEEEQIYNRGVITLALIEKLELMGYSVSLNLFEMSTSGSQLHYSNYRLKTDSERVNLQKLYFPMCHPSFLRRLIFRLTEVTPDIERHWSSGYGRPSDKRIIKEMLDLKDDDIIIESADMIGLTGEDLIEDTNIMFDYINRNNKKEKIKLEKVKKLTR